MKFKFSLNRCQQSTFRIKYRNGYSIKKYKYNLGIILWAESKYQNHA